ncbi:MAG TPA: hypothetical protein VGL55_02020 [Steroidobacteraceae bacterium]|jgi:hypothetical protein
MRLRKSQLCGLWALGALAATLQGARAQDESVPSATQVARSASVGQAQPASPVPVHPSAATTASAAPMTCFKLTLHCFGGNPTPSDAAPPVSARSATAGAATKDATAAAPPRSHSLNLAPPDIRTIVPQEELAQPLPTEDQQASEADSETVDVRTDPDTPNVPGGFGALWWAMRHPTQVWRIFAPVE